MKNKKIYTYVFASIFAICTFGFVWSFIVTKDIRKDTDKALKQEQRVIVNSLALTETKNNKKYWELYAKRGEYEGSKNIIVLKNIIGNFYNDKEEVVLSFTANEGTYNEAKKIITLQGDVLAVAKDNSSIRADAVVWRGQNENIIAVGNVQINRNNELLTQSNKAVFNSELTYFKIEGKSQSQIYKEKGDK